MLKEEELKADKYRQDAATTATRELTIGELLDRRINKAKKLANTLEDLRASLPSSYLDSGASRITSIIEL